MNRRSLQSMEEHIAALRAGDSFRGTRVVDGVGARVRIHGREIVNFSSNDYLDMAGKPCVARAAAHDWGPGAGASQLMSGHLTAHEALERVLADWLGHEAALLFGSGYLGNVGAISAIVSRGDLVVVDRLAHASILDGIRLGGSRFRRFPHNDAAALDALLARHACSARRVLVVTESVFSMDGDLAPLVEIAEVARRHGALFFVDEAHALGIFGREGAGRSAELPAELRPDLVLGTFGKALGSYGAFIACSALLRDYLVNTARTCIYSTAPPPPCLAAAQVAICEVRHAEPPGLGPLLHDRCRIFRSMLRGAGFTASDDPTPIIPIHIGDNTRTVALAQQLLSDGVLATAIRPPTVPQGTSRLRLSVTLGHTDDDFELLVDSLTRHAPPEVRR